MEMEPPSTPNISVSAELLLISPLVRSGSPSLSRKRQVTPTFEASSPQKIAVISPPGHLSPLQSRAQRPVGLNPSRWPTIAQDALIDERQPLLLNPLKRPAIEEETPFNTRQLLLPNPLSCPQTYISPHGPPQAAPLYQNTPRSAPQLPWSQLLLKAREIIVPFDLRDDPDALSKPENREVLTRIFPATIGVGSDGRFLYIYVSEMPPKPWPKKIAGLPLYLAPHPGPEHSPIPSGWRVPRKNGTIADQMDGRDMKPWTPIFEVIRDHFIALEISIIQVMYFGNFLIIVLEHRYTDTAKLPWKVARIPCQYLFDDEMGRPQVPQARRLADPTPGHPDLSQYVTLQPGVRVTSGYFPTSSGLFQATTTGVLVKDNIGNEFMTVAAHGFPAQCGTDVSHALPSNGRMIGKVIYEVSHTDIGLVSLEPHETFLNMMFENNETTEPVRLKRLIPYKETQPGDDIILDSPDTGRIEGTLQHSAYLRIPVDDPSAPQQAWVFATWLYMGQDSGENLVEGMCGSAIWNAEGDVISFFRYAPVGGDRGSMAGWCVGIAADELINRGFTLVDTTGREA